jgi:hypothetical protein
MKMKCNHILRTLIPKTQEYTFGGICHLCESKITFEEILKFDLREKTVERRLKWCEDTSKDTVYTVLLETFKSENPIEVYHQAKYNTENPIERKNLANFIRSVLSTNKFTTWPDLLKLAIQ